MNNTDFPFKVKSYDTTTTPEKEAVGLATYQNISAKCVSGIRGKQIKCYDLLVMEHGMWQETQR